MIDSWFPWLVGNRTQLIFFAVTVLKILAAFGVIPSSTVATVDGILVPAGAATLAAKMSRDTKKK